jgi:hypothetical protein
MSISRLALGFVLAHCAIACTSSITLPLDGGTSYAGHDAGRDAGEPLPVPTTITLENAGSAPIVIGDQCGGSFLSLKHGEQALAYDRSCACACEAGMVCGCPAICRITEQLVVPGKDASIDWDGLWLRYDDPSCYELAGLRHGDEVTAKACYHLGAGIETCDETTFAYGAERNVKITAQPHSAARSPASIVLENRTGGPIRIITNHCGTQSWFQLALPDERASLSVFCPCSCTAEHGLGICPTCGECADDELETVANGAEHSFEWDGMFWYEYESGCTERYAMPAGYMVQARVCFLRAGESAPTCQPIGFIHGEGASARATVY